MTKITVAIKEFLLHCTYEKKLNDKTLKAYSIDLRQFKVFLSEKTQITSIEEISKDMLLAYNRKLHEDYKVKSIKRKFACIKALFNYYEFEQEDFLNPFRKIRLKLTEPFHLPTVMSFSEVRKIFRHVYLTKEALISCSENRYRTIVRDIAILELLFATGLRVSELTNLASNCINLEDGVVKVHGKGGKDRIIQVCNVSVIRALKEYRHAFQEAIDETGWFFINRLNTRLSEQSARNVVKKYAIESKVSRSVTPHTYRHTFATMLLEEGVDIKYIQKLLGHSSIMTTQIYTHVSTVKQKEILSTKHPRNRMTMLI